MADKYIYDYFGVTEAPNYSTFDEEGNLIGGIVLDVQNSSMDNKDLEWHRWDENDSHMELCFGTGDLTPSDKHKLNLIVAANSTYTTSTTTS